MKRLIILAAVSAVALAGITTIARAQQAPASPPMTDAMVAHIRSVCSMAQTNVARLRASDALLRVNQGQALESISTRLMTPFNSRVALDQLDGGRMTSITSVYVTQLDAFRLDYQQYEEAISKAAQTDCTKQPVAFYDAISDARNKRVIVHDRMAALQKSLQDYLGEFDAFAGKVNK